MKKPFVQRYQILSGTSLFLLHQMFRDLAGDCTTSSRHISKDVESRLLLTLDSDDPIMVHDLRHLNSGCPEAFTAFWAAAKAFLKLQAMAAVNSRQHGQVCHMAAAL